MMGGMGGGTMGQKGKPADANAQMQMMQKRMDMMQMMMQTMMDQQGMMARPEVGRTPRRGSSRRCGWSGANIVTRPTGQRTTPGPSSCNAAVSASSDRTPEPR